MNEEEAREGATEDKEQASEETPRSLEASEEKDAAAESPVE